MIAFRKLDSHPEAQTNRNPLIWLSLAVAMVTALAYLLIQFGILRVGDLTQAEEPSSIVYICAASYFLGGLLILLHRRWLWTTGAVINALVILFFLLAYLNRPAVLFSPGGMVTKAAQILLEAGLVYLLITTSRRLSGYQVAKKKS
jgi:hypothetical protein